MNSQQRQLICVLPWFQLEQTVEGPPAWFLPFDVRAGHPGLDPALHQRLTGILSSYRGLQGVPITKATLVSDGLQFTISTEADEVIEKLSREIDRLAFVTLANNRYGDRMALSYSNSTYFQHYFQRFSVDADYVSLETRRRDGRALDGGYRPGELCLSIPPEASGRHVPKLLILEQRLDSVKWMVRDTDGETGWRRIESEAWRHTLHRHFDAAWQKSLVAGHLAKVGAVQTPTSGPPSSPSAGGTGLESGESREGADE